MATPTLAALQAYAKIHLGYDGVSKHDFARALSELYAVHGMTLPVNGRNGVDLDRVLAEPNLQSMMDAWAEPNNRAALEPRRHLIRDIQENLGVTAGEYAQNDKRAHDNIPGHNTLTKLSFYYAERGQGIPLNSTYQIDWDKVHSDVAGQAKQIEVAKSAPEKTTVAPPKTAAAPEPKPVITDPNVTLAKESTPDTNFFKKLDPKSYTPVSRTLNGVETINQPQTAAPAPSAAIETGSVIPPLTTEKTVALKGDTNSLWNLSSKLNSLGVTTDAPAPVAPTPAVTISTRSFAPAEPVKPVAEPAVAAPKTVTETKTVEPMTRTVLPDVKPIIVPHAQPELAMSQITKDAIDHLEDRVQAPEIKKPGLIKRIAQKVDHAVDKTLDGAVNVTESVIHSRKDAAKKEAPAETNVAGSHEHHNELIDLKGRNKFGLRRLMVGEERFPIVNKTDAEGKDVPVRWNPIGQHEVKHKETLAGKIVQDVAIRAENTAIRVVTTPVRFLENLFDLNGDGKKSPKNFPRERGDILNTKNEAEYCVSAEENAKDRITNPGPIEHIQKAFKNMKIEDAEKVQLPQVGGNLKSVIDTVKKNTGQTH